MTVVWVVVGLVVAAWLLRKLWAGDGQKSSSAPAARLSSTQKEIEIRWPTLPNDGEAAIVKALQAGKEPPEDWRTGTWNARYQKVVGESFTNPNGSSRQEILKQARPGQRVFLLPEPSNEFDPNAVAVYLDAGGGRAAQIGYLPRDSYLGADVGECAIAAWIARVAQAKGTSNRGAALYVAWDEHRR